MNRIPLDVNSEVVYNNRKDYTPNMLYTDVPACFMPHSSTLNYNYSNQNGRKFWFEQRQKDKEFINHFVTNIQKKNDEKVETPPLKIFEAKQLILKIISLKKSLECIRNDLDVNEDNFDSKWNLIEEKMSIINKYMTKLYSTIGPLKKMLQKRLKKREGIKKRKLKANASKEEMKKVIESKHKFIDKLLNERNDEVEAVKREAALKRQADSVLHEVRRKKYEGTKILNMLSALKKLRDLRIKEEEKKGGYCSKQLTSVFNEVVIKFQKLWERQIEVYKLEEKGLKMMLEENSVPHVKTTESEMNYLQWERALFGDIANSKEAEFLTRADHDMEAFIKIRQDWDQFLVREPTAISSSIPLGWVVPPETNDENWKKYLIQSKKVTD